MATRERIEAEIDVLTDLACKAMLSGNIAVRLILADSVDRLRSILADTPAETPPTLAEFRESGDLFLGMDHNSGIYLCRFRKDRDGKLYDIRRDVQIYCADPFASIKRLCDRQWYPVECGE